MTRKDTKVINIGGRKIGGGNPVADPVDDQIQRQRMWKLTVAQIQALRKGRL